MSVRRPNVWSYVSFSRPSSRANDSYLPYRNGDAADPYEKPGRRSSLNSGPPPYSPASRRSRNTQLQYLKIGGAIVFVLFIVYIISQRGQKGRPILPGDTRTKVEDQGGREGQIASEAAAQSAKCTKSHDPSKPVTQYALMIDAGSTGSRIHVYRFNNCGPSPELEDELFEQTEKKPGGSGLSSYDSDAEGAAQSLDVLLDKAVQKVPESYRSCSPVAVKATAGLRKLGEEKSSQILKAVRQRLETKYPFPVLAEEKGGVEVMDGKYEGIYAWITTNYLLGNIGSSEKTPTAAVFDLGGGSTQIVFEPTFPEQKDGGMPQTLKEGDHKYELSFGGRDFTLYQHSYLGYGLMSARESLHQAVLLSAYDAYKSTTSPPDISAFLKNPIENPCIQPSQSRLIDLPLPADHPITTSVNDNTATINMTSPSSSQRTISTSEECLAFAKKILNKEKDCALTPCAFDGVHQPPLASTFAQNEIYLFSYFYDRLEPLGMPESFTLNDLKSITDEVCAGEKGGEGWTRFRKVQGAVEELRDRPEHCLDLNFMLGLLNEGYEIPMERNVKMAKKIQGNELGWCLGASLPLLSQESGWKCKIKEVG